jgi:hypothetical protein
MKVKYIGKGWYKFKFAGKWYFFTKDSVVEVPDALGNYLVKTGQFVVV